MPTTPHRSIRTTARAVLVRVDIISHTLGAIGDVEHAARRIRRHPHAPRVASVALAVMSTALIAALCAWAVACMVGLGGGASAAPIQVCLSAGVALVATAVLAGAVWALAHTAEVPQ